MSIVQRILIPFFLRPFFATYQRVHKQSSRIFRKNCQKRRFACAKKFRDIRLITSRKKTFSDPSLTTNGVRGKGEERGSFDSFSLNHAEGHRIKHCAGKRYDICNGKGSNFIVFENAFAHRYSEAVIVSVSQDESKFIKFPYEIVKKGETPCFHEPAGLPITLYYDKNTDTLDPLDKKNAGGDHFNLDDLPDTPFVIRTKREEFCYLQLKSAKHLYPNQNRYHLTHGNIDSVYARYFTISH